MSSRNRPRIQSRDPADYRRYLDSGSSSAKSATGRKFVESRASCGHKKVTGLENPPYIQMRDRMSIATWNVQGLKTHVGKLGIVERELKRYFIEIAGISETHWHGNGFFETSHNNFVYFSGSDQQTYTGVAIILTRKIQKCVIDFKAVSDRIISLKINAKPHPMNFVQVYAPTTSSSDNEIEEFYNQLTATLEQIPNKEFTIVCGDFNAKIGKIENNEDMKAVVGRHGMGERNERGDRLLDFAIDNNLTIMNTVFCHHIRRLYTWKSPGDRTRNQIDYILTSSRWKSSFATARTYPGATCGSDHKLLAGRIRLKLKNTNKPTQLNRMEVRNLELFQQQLEKTLPLIHSDMETQQIWDKTKDWMYNAVSEQPCQRKKKRKHWISDNTLLKIDERRRMMQRGVNSDEQRADYSRLNKEIKQACIKDKNHYYSNVCEEIERHALTNQPRDLFKKIKFLTREFRARTWAIENEEGCLITSHNEIAETWRLYCEKLYRSEDFHINQIPDINIESDEPDILKIEVEAAIKKMKPFKSPGPDGITAEIIQATGEQGITMIHKLCNKIWHSQQWPTDWTSCSIKTLHKKGSVTNCDNYRTITLISHASKVLLQIINERLEKYIQPQIPPEQAGFSRGRGTRDQLLNIRQIIEKAREFNNSLYLCFLDYRKAFDKVKWAELWSVLNEMGVPAHLTCLIKSLYTNTKCHVIVNDTKSEEFQPQCGVRQGCILSPRLFNLYGEYIMRRALDEWQGGISINGRMISNLRFADDTVLLAGSEEELLQILNTVERESVKLGLELNINKTKIMIVDRRNDNRPDIVQIDRFKVVSEYMYLGSLISNTGTVESEIRRRCALAKVAMQKLKKVWQDRNISKQVKSRLVKSLVFPILTYGCEAWTLRKSEIKKLDATEMYCWRRMLRIPWTARRTNDSIITELNVQQRMSSLIQTKIIKFFGHIMRKDQECLEKLIVQGKIPGRRPRGRSPSRWVDQIVHLTNKPLHTLVHEAQDREVWRRTAHDATN